MKYAFIKEQRRHHPVARLCAALKVSRSGYYAWLSRPLSQRALSNQRLLKQVVQIYADSLKTYGSPRIHAALRHQGECISLGRVARLMQRSQIAARPSKRHKRTYQLREPQVPADNLLNRQFYTMKPNRSWVSDITFIETKQGWLYLAVVLDLYSRAIVGWSMSQKIDGKLVLDALKMAVDQRSPRASVLVHSDQGSQYTAQSYRRYLQDNKMICSMSRKGECHDNAVAESFFHTLKTELVYGKKYATRAEAKQDIFKYIELFYNRKRLHSYLNYQAPLEYEKINAVA